MHTLLILNNQGSQLLISLLCMIYVSMCIISKSIKIWVICEFRAMGVEIVEIHWKLFTCPKTVPCCRRRGRVSEGMRFHCPCRNMRGRDRWGRRSAALSHFQWRRKRSTSSSRWGKRRSCCWVGCTPRSTQFHFDRWTWCCCCCWVLTTRLRGSGGRRTRYLPD